LRTSELTVEIPDAMNYEHTVRTGLPVRYSFTTVITNHYSKTQMQNDLLIYLFI